MADSTDHSVFHCTRCGNCCRWPGIVRLSTAEIEAIADYLGMPEDDFVQLYTDITPDRRGLTLIDRPDGACIMLDDDDSCRIQPVKPQQCRDFPHKWNFPGWEKECPAVRLHYTMRRLNGDQADEA